ncbi:hypothetical protein V5P93_004855 [Actinokineospora auranticolor]|uniref:Uncharacterized protein n=1 Tax=Actinokineospora auranticolor TaxID=155976 RepID=A0A2S6GNM7_9PSEU|nr:hypothetical protein [Actinokineospora auranticolor]PPK66817.1 hypothetical protein CLV40_109202 [Actinokineospora auranticolor]
MDGIGITVALADGTLSVTPTNAVGRLALGGGPLSVPVREIAAVTVHEAGPLRNGRLDLRLRDGRRYQLAFTRAHQEEFSRLRGILAAQKAPVVPLPRPADQAPPLRGRGHFAQPVVEIQTALRALSGEQSTGERVTTAELRLRDGAVQVLVEGHAVGHLPPEGAAAYRVPLERLGGAGACRARLWWTRDRPEFAASVALDIADPEFALPITSVDQAALRIPPGRPFQLTRESDHLDVLVPIIDRAYLPGRALVEASLHLDERAGPRSTSVVVALRVDGAEIGELGKQTSGRLRALVGPLEEAGVPCYADVQLVGNAFAVEGRVLITPPEELPAEFIQRVQGLLRA